MNEEDQLKILETSKKFVLLLIIGIVISYINLEIQEKLILCPNDTELQQSLKKRQIFGNVLVTAALIYFYKLTGQTAAQANCENETANIGYTASTFNLVAGLMRLTDLLNNENTTLTQQEEIVEDIDV